jgi:mycofactocin precursor
MKNTEKTDYFREHNEVFVKKQKEESDHALVEDLSFTEITIEEVAIDGICGVY